MENKKPKDGQSPNTDDESLKMDTNYGDDLSEENINHIIHEKVQKHITSQASSRKEHVETPSSFKIVEGSELYKHTDNGPFFVIAEQKLIDPYWLGQMLLKVFKMQNILNLDKISKEKVRIHVKDYHNANKIIKLSAFDRFKDMKMYIPKNYVYIDGIIKGIPTSISDEEINDEISSKVPIERIERLDFWDQKTKSLQKSTTIKLTFRSSNVPDQVYLYLVPNRVELYIQKPLFCQVCLSYGHTKKYCHTETPLCRICTKPIHDQTMECQPTCKDCTVAFPNNKDHLTAAFICPTYKFQREVKRTMIIKKVTFKEAHTELQKLNPTPNRYYRPPPPTHTPTPQQLLDTANKNISYSDVLNKNKTSTCKPDRHKIFILKLINIINTCTTQGTNSDLILQEIGSSLCEYAADDNGHCDDEFSANVISMPSTSLSHSFLESRRNISSLNNV